MLKLALDADAFKKLPADVQKEYKKADEDGKEIFKLDVEGWEDPGPLKRAKDHEKTARQEVEKKLKDTATNLEALQAELDDLRRGNIPKGDVAKLEDSWKTKLGKAETEAKATIGLLESSIRELLIDNVATTMAAKISTAPDVILPHIRARLTAEQVDGKFSTRVLGSDGKPSALTVVELEKEITSNKSFSPIIIGSKASGSGAAGAKGGSGAPPSGDLSKIVKPSDMVAHIKAKQAAQTGG